MAVMNTYAKVSFLWWLVCMVPLLPAQELENFPKGSTFDFKKNKVLAEIPPSAENLQTKDSSMIDDAGLLTSTTMSTSFTDETPTGFKEEPRRRIDNPVPQKDNMRLSRVIGADGSTMPESTTYESTMSESTIAMREIEIFPTATKSSNPTMQSNLETPPNIRMPRDQEPKIVYKKDQDNYSIQCQADGNPKPTFQWRKDGVILDLHPNIDTDVVSGKLVFTKFTKGNNGVYECLASNKYGISVSEKVLVLMEVPPIKAQENLIQSVEAIEGQPMKFGCVNTPETIPRYIKRWNVGEKSSQLDLTDRFGTDSEGVLRFAYVEKGDANSYRCALAPKDASSSTTIELYNIVNLKVKASSKPELIPKLEYSNNNVKAILGKSITLECFFSGNPVPIITWRKSSSNGVITVDNTKYVDDFGRKLIFRKVIEDDADTYTCTANNGVITVHATIVVNVTGPPQKIPNEGLDRHIKPSGDDQVFKCKAKGIGQPSLNTPQWYRNGKPFNQSSLPFPGRYKFNDDLTELTINNLDTELDTACFQCSISNSEGSLLYDGYLRVINSIKIHKKPTDFVINNKSSIDISVHASGDDCCHIKKKWFLNGKPLPDKTLLEAPYEWANGGNDLMFHASTVDNETLQSKVGNYMCRVYNDYQIVNVTFTITFKEEELNPEQIIAKAGGFELWWIGLVCGIIFIIIAIAIIIVILKSNYPRETYLLEKAEIKHNLNPEQDLLDQSFHEV